MLFCVHMCVWWRFVVIYFKRITFKISSIIAKTIHIHVNCLTTPRVHLSCWKESILIFLHPVRSLPQNDLVIKTEMSERMSDDHLCLSQCYLLSTSWYCHYYYSSICPSVCYSHFIKVGCVFSFLSHLPCYHIQDIAYCVSSIYSTSQKFGMGKCVQTFDWYCTICVLKQPRLSCLTG